MATIVEKVVSFTADKQIVARLFWDRMKTSQRVENCDTLAYFS